MCEGKDYSWHSVCVCVCVFGGGVVMAFML